jgi:hypothetical protein
MASAMSHRYVVRHPRHTDLFVVFDTAEERPVFTGDKAAAIKESQRRNGWRSNGDPSTYAAQIRRTPWTR